MTRRHCFLWIFALALVVGAVTVGAAQETKPARIVVLSRSAATVSIQELREGLRKLGHVEGRTYTIEHRHAEDSTARLRELAVEVARSRPDVIFAPHGVDGSPGGSQREADAASA